jgi:hypothetical protein
MIDYNEPMTTEIREDGIMLMKLTGGLGNDVVEPLKSAVRVGTQMIKNHRDKIGKNVNILFDMTTFTGEYSVNALQVFVDFSKETKPFVAKTACYGGPITGQVAGEMVATLAGRDNIHFFRTYEEALKWLQE